MSILLQDMRFALRMLWKHRLATLVSIIALALGIGANTAIFSVAEAFLLRPVPFDNANRLAAFVDLRPQQNIDIHPVAPATFLDWKKQVHSFDELAAYEWNEISLTGDREPQKVQAFSVASNFFHLINVQPEMGRAFLPEEEEPGKAREIILSHGLWERRYASDPNILNKTIKVDGANFTVVGVMQKGFDFPMPAEAWVPMSLTMAERNTRDRRSLWVLAHLRPGASMRGATAEIEAISQQQAASYPDVYKGWQLKVMPLGDFVTGDLTRQYTLLLMGGVAFVLLIACVNVANVQLARMSGRSRELAVRSALGGSRWRIVRQLLTESVLLSLGGAVLGLFLAQWYLQMILAHMPADVARFIAGWKTIHLDAGAYIFTLGIACASGILSGIAPSLLSSRTRVGETLKEGGRGSSGGSGRHRVRNALVVAEMALSIVLLIGAGLLVKNFRGLLAVNDSYAPETLLTMNLTLSDKQYTQGPTRATFFDQALLRLSNLPEVQSAALATRVPYSNGGGVGDRGFSIEGRPPAERGEVLSAIVQTVSPNYFRTMNITLRDGRELADSDGAEAAPVCVISDSLVGRFFGGRSPIGRKIRVDSSTAPGPWMTVVGITSDVRYSWINKQIVPTIYRSFRQSPPFYTTLVLRTAGNPLDVVSAARAEAAALDPNLPLYNIKPLDRLIIESIMGIAYVATMMAVLGVIALVLASVGVYGVMSYAVSERTHEIGIRMSLGADTRDILALILRNGMALTGLGLAIGLPLALLMARALSALLFGVEAADPAAFIGLPLLLAAIATLASYLPAHRAARLDPLQALRYE